MKLFSKPRVTAAALDKNEKQQEIDILGYWCDCNDDCHICDNCHSCDDCDGL